MIVRFNLSKSLRHVIYYNENKVREGTAKCIQAVNYGISHVHLGDTEKMERIRQLTKRNGMSQKNIAHITLSFAPGEKFSTSKLNAISERFMNRIGYSDQPYLVYLHSDTANQHLHIVSTIIRPDGTRMPTHMFGATVVADARVEIEQEFGLVPATGKGEHFIRGIAPLDLQQYLQGGARAKASVSAVVRSVISRYRFTSLSEFNAILKQFNVVADPGLPGSLLQERGGLLYSGIDENGEKAGAQIRASAIYFSAPGNQPNHAGLKMLVHKFEFDKKIKKNLKKALVRKVEQVIKRGVTRQEFEEGLHQLGVATAFRYNVNSNLSGVTFIDNHEGVVFNGSDLKKGLSAAGISARLLTVTKIERKIHQQFVQNLLSTTNFSAGFDSVLRYWRDGGAGLHAIALPDGEYAFSLGAAHLPPSSWPPVPQRIGAYILANAEHRQRSSRRIDQDQDVEHGAFRRFFMDHHHAGFLRLSLVEQLFEIETADDQLPYELLREARKNQRKKRKKSR